jgi:hypothetical protein
MNSGTAVAGKPSTLDRPDRLNDVAGHEPMPMACAASIMVDADHDHRCRFRKYPGRDRAHEAMLDRVLDDQEAVDTAISACGGPPSCKEHLIDVVLRQGLRRKIANDASRLDRGEYCSRVNCRWL